MFDKLKYITLSGKEFPYKCDILVLEKIQDEYPDLADFENKLTGFVPSRDEEGKIKRNEDGYMIGTTTIPDIKTVNKALCWMVREGLEIEADDKGLPIEKISDKEILRKVDISPNQLGGLLREEFARCITRKNEETT